MPKSVASCKLTSIQLLSDGNYYVRWDLLDDVGNRLGESQCIFGTDPNNPVSDPDIQLTSSEVTSVRNLRSSLEQKITSSRYA